jgi:hypothetical protein
MRVSTGGAPWQRPQRLATVGATDDLPVGGEGESASVRAATPKP